MAVIALVVTALATQAIPVRVAAGHRQGLCQAAATQPPYRALVRHAAPASWLCWRWEPRCVSINVSWLGERVVADIRLAVQANLLRHWHPAFSRKTVPKRNLLADDFGYRADRAGRGHHRFGGAAQCRSPRSLGWAFCSGWPPKLTAMTGAGDPGGGGADRRVWTAGCARSRGPARIALPTSDRDDRRSARRRTDRPGLQPGSNAKPQRFAGAVERTFAVAKRRILIRVADDLGGDAADLRRRSRC